MEIAASRASRGEDRRAPAGPARVNVTVGRLVVHGWSRLAAGRVGAAFERSLGELIGSRGVPDAWSEGALERAALALPSRAWRDADTLGRALAEAMFDRAPRHG